MQGQRWLDQYEEASQRDAAEQPAVAARLALMDATADWDDPETLTLTEAEQERRAEWGAESKEAKSQAECGPTCCASPVVTHHACGMVFRNTAPCGGLGHARNCSRSI